MGNGLKDIADYRGPAGSEPKGFRVAIGRFVTLIMESKYAELYTRCCRSLSGDFSIKRLGGDGADHMVHSWSQRSKTALSQIAKGYGSAEEIKEVMQILNELFVLQLDAYNAGMFTHEPLPDLPRKDVWEPIDAGIGDRLIDRPQARKAKFAPPPALHRNAVRRATNGTQKKSVGLRGGGAGGESQAPKWFIDWSQVDDDEERCDRVMQEARAMGLKVIETKLIIKEKVQSNKSTSNDGKGNHGDSTKENTHLSSSKEGKSIEQDKHWGKNNKEGNSNEDKTHSQSSKDAKKNEEGKTPPGSSSDGKSKEKAKKPPISTSYLSEKLKTAIEELQGHDFVGDDVINMFFEHLSETFGDEYIEFVGANRSHLLSYGGEVALAGLDLTFPRITLFPVNDNENNDLGGGEGTHWSLLVLDNNGERPRFIHHDSLGGVNSPAAHRLANAIRQAVPNTEDGVVEARTPRQDNSWDCAIFVMAMARSIARWWASLDQDDWHGRLEREVNSESVSTLRLQLAEVLLGKMSFADLD